MTSKPSTTNCPKLSSVLPDFFKERAGLVTHPLSCVALHSFLLVEIGHLIRLMFNGQLEKIYQVVIAAGSHLFPFRTEKLSPFAPMVLQCNAGE